MVRENQDKVIATTAKVTTDNVATTNSLTSPQGCARQSFSFQIAPTIQTLHRERTVLEAGTKQTQHRVGVGDVTRTDARDDAKDDDDDEMKELAMQMKKRELTDSDFDTDLEDIERGTL